ncbi:MAG: glycoside hydrolase family 30 beta sandwich domain-containing protein [Rariglobus sp.]|nr:glycoside hydrolase family 30 protein [Rariglobus sp.]
MTASARTWTLHETARDNGRRLAPVPLPSGPHTGTLTPVITLDPGRTFQEIVGFGGALTESSAWALAQLPPARRAEVVRAYFHPTEGLAYNLARTHINSCDFSVNSWALADTPGDHALASFTLEPMRRWVMPLLHEARAVGGADLRFLASPWSPPAWMKTNANMLLGGKLREDCRDTWARYYVRFLKAMRAEEGIDFWALTVQNEPAATQPWESCIYSPEEERDFIRDHLGPVLAASAHHDTKIISFDHNRDILEAYAGAVFADPAAARFVWGAALHWYVSEDFAATSRLLKKFPDKHVLFSEGCWEGGAKPGQWDRGARYARNIIGDLNHGVCGWIDWNIVLDIKGGPNHVGNLCDAPVLVDPATQEVLFQSSFYYIGHFSKFIRPGARRIACENPVDGMQATAFRNPDSTLAVVVHNPGPDVFEFTLACGTDRIAVCIPAFAIQTYTSSAR